jgi:Na+-transporting NADH:ubiquinone oxidoreductase subunit NqrC
MKALNAPERQSAFLYFLLFFVITVALVVAAIFFGMQVPFKQNQQLQHKMNHLQNEVVFADNFSAKMAGTKGILDTVNKAGIQAELLDQSITDGLKGLSAMVNSDTSINKNFYTSVIQNLTELQFAKKQLRDASSANQDLSNYVQQIETLKSDLFRAQSQVDALRAQLASMSK